MPAAIRAAVEPAAVSEGAVVVHCQGVVAVDAADLGSFFVRLQHARSIARYIDRVLGPDQPEAPEPHRRPRCEHDDPDDEDVADELVAAVVVVAGRHPYHLGPHTGHWPSPERRRRISARRICSALLLSLGSPWPPTDCQVARENWTPPK